jgi:hypothetical protein
VKQFEGNLVGDENEGKDVQEDEGGVGDDNGSGFGIGIVISFL